MTEVSFPLWGPGWRERGWSRLDQEWDLVIIGGGITGAGLLNEAGRRGWRALLVEERDFAWGTSSRSSKLVHGGMRYIKQGKLRLSRDLLLERDLLLREIRGLVDPLPFLLPVHRERKLDRPLFGFGVLCYDLLRGRGKSWRWHGALEMEGLIPGTRASAFLGGYRYQEAVTDDARLVLRVLREGVAKGGGALSYVRAEPMVREGEGVVGVELHDALQDRRLALRAPVVVNATGAEGDAFRRTLGRKRTLRALRGAHILLPGDRIPLDAAVSFRHPADGRHLYLLPWEGATLVGATDLDHAETLSREPRATEEEVAYLLEFLRRWVPDRAVGREDIVSTYAGVRPVVWTGRRDTSNEPRDSVYLEESGLVTVVSGKLTGFRRTVERALDRISRRLPEARQRRDPLPFFTPGGNPGHPGMDPAHTLRLHGRYGPDAGDLLASAPPGDLEIVPGTRTLWAEVRWGARAEGVVHLDDLLLRRTRLGLLLPEGGRAFLDRVRAICMEELGWDGDRWEKEERGYLDRVRENYGVPGGG